MDAEMATVDYLNSSGVGVPAYPDVPADRPERFVTVLRTGGASGEAVTERALLSVRCWAPTRREAAELGESVRLALLDMPSSVDNVARVGITSTFRDTDLESGTPRYRVVCELYCNR